MNDVWAQLDQLRWVTERAGTLHPLQEKQLGLWPRAVYFQSVKSVFTWTPGERTELTEGRIEKTIKDLRKKGIIQRKSKSAKSDAQSAKPERGWKRRPEIKFDITLDRKAAEPEGLSKRLEIFVESLRRMLGTGIKISLVFDDGQKKVFELRGKPDA